MSEEYRTFVTGLIKPGQEILREMTPGQAHLWHLATGVSGEAGELIDAIKKHVVYQKVLDRANVIEEIGDLLFYIEGLMDAIGIDAEYAKEQNMAKLKRRYHDGKYSNKQAISRADKDVTDRDFVTR
jgi:NTP pyrophosphatase (non-canonical NTP hydrolase)